MTEALLDLRDLAISFQTESGRFRVVDGLNLSVKRGKTLGLVGESGCGKSVTSLSILRLLECPPGHIDSGSVFFDGKDLLTLTEEQMRQIRGNRISMIFQEPMTSLNPVLTIGEQIAEVYRIHQRLNRKEALNRAREMLNLVRIPSPDLRLGEYPHQLSGGMRQRVMIAIALACRPEMLIADEPTTALDVTIQAQILNLMNHLQKELGMSILMITHDLGVVAEVCDDVVVMYAGKAVESGSSEEIFRNPQHPYTQGLLRSVPRLGQKASRLETIEGVVPSLSKRPSGCRFHDRCPQVRSICRESSPPDFVHSATHRVACWQHQKEDG